MKNQNPLSHLHSTCAVAALADVMVPPAERNAWKARMLKAGLTNLGLTFPADWDSLPEAEKQRRLDGALKVGLEA